MDFNQWFAVHAEMSELGASKYVERHPETLKAFNAALAIGEARGLERAAALCADDFEVGCEGSAWARLSRQAITNPDQFVGADKLIHKQIACDFFRWWYNQPGSNTEQGFDDWWENQQKEAQK